MATLLLNVPYDPITQAVQRVVLLLETQYALSMDHHGNELSHAYTVYRILGEYVMDRLNGLHGLALSHYFQEFHELTPDKLDYIQGQFEAAYVAIYGVSEIANCDIQLSQEEVEHAYFAFPDCRGRVLLVLETGPVDEAFPPPRPPVMMSA